MRFDDERCLLWAQLTKDAYALVKAAIAGRARRHDHPSSNDPDFVRFESRCADALLDICIERGRRSRKTGPPRRRAPGSGVRSAYRWPQLRRRYRPRDTPTDARHADADGDASPGHRSARISMVVHTDLERLLYGDGYGHASIEGVGPISAEVARRLACSRRHHACRSTLPTAPASTRRHWCVIRRKRSSIEIRRRDNGCRFPGCGCRTVTDIHHVVWASKQGPTIMSNLLTLCVAHHSRVHELGWKLDGDAQGEVRFISPQGHVFVSMPSPAWRPPRK